VQAQVIALARQRYLGANHTHFTEPSGGAGVHSAIPIYGEAASGESRIG